GDWNRDDHGLVELLHDRKHDHHPRLRRLFRGCKSKCESDLELQRLPDKLMIVSKTHVSVAIGLALVASAAVFVVKHGDGGASRSLRGPAGDTFALEYPVDWKQVSPPSIGTKQPVLVALRNNKGDAEVVVHRSGRIVALNKQLVDTLGHNLR